MVKKQLQRLKSDGKVCCAMYEEGNQRQVRYVDKMHFLKRKVYKTMCMCIHPYTG